MITNLHKVIDAIVKRLFQAEDRRSQSWIDKIVKLNQEVRGPSVMGFLYGGTFYRASWVRGPIAKKQALSPSLGEHMEHYLKDQKAIDTDKAFIRQSLFALLEPCQNDQDVRDTLPECIIDALPEYKNNFTRTRDAAFTIQDNERALRQYLKILPKMEEYSISRLIY